MEGLGLTAFDAVALAVVLISAVMAFARGLIREVFSIVAFFAAIFAAIWLHRYVAPMLEGAVGNPLFATLFAGFLIFLVVFVAITVITSMLAKAAHNSDEIGTLDRGAGLLFGAARGVLIVSLFVLLVRAALANVPGWMVEARFYPFFERTATVLEGLGPPARTYIDERQAGKSPAEAARAATAPAPAPAPAAEPK